MRVTLCPHYVLFSGNICRNCHVLEIYVLQPLMGKTSPQISDQEVFRHQQPIQNAKITK